MGDKDICVDVKKKAVDERLAEVDSFFLNVELNFPNVEENVIREKLEEDEFLIDELVGLSVFDINDNKLGFVVGVSNNGANDLLSVKTNSKNICLVPFVKAFVISVSIKDKKIVINNQEGLLQ